MLSTTLFPEKVFLLLIIISRHAVRTSWRGQPDPLGTNDKRSASPRVYKWYTLKDESKEKLCRMNDRSRYQKLLQPILVPRIVGTPEHEQVAWHLANTLSSLGFDIDWDRFSSKTPHGTKSFENLVATYDKSAERRLVLACHYDSKIFPGKVFIGATDSAVPCALLLDLASTLGPLLASRKNKEVTLQLMFFDGEEAFNDWTETDSLYGSRHLVEIMKKQYYPYTGKSSFVITNELDRIDLLILLDLIGARLPHFFNFANYSATRPYMKMVDIENDLNRLHCTHNIPQMFLGRTLPATQMVADDHKPFHKHGVPIVHLISLPFPAVWHTIHDNADIIDNITIENINAILRVFVAMFLGIVP